MLTNEMTVTRTRRSRDRLGPHLALSAPPFLHSERNFLRSLPCKPLASASFEHSRDAAVRGLAILSAGAIFPAGAGVAGAVVCAKAEPISNTEAMAVAARRLEIVIIVTPVRLKEAQPRLAIMNHE